MTNNTGLDSLFDRLTKGELSEPLPYNFREDYSMKDLVQPEDL